MNRKKALFGIIAVLVIGLAAAVSCAAPSYETYPTTTYPAPIVPEAMPPYMPSEGGSGIIDKGEAPAPTITVDQLAATDRMIVRTANMSLVVQDIPIAMNQIIQLTKGFEGYVVSSNRWGEGERLFGTITIRVAAEHFETAMTALRDLAVEVTSETTSSQDVTEEYVDLNSRLKNAEATEQQYLILLEKATAIEDILKIYDGLSRIRGEIEQIKGRMQYLERTSDTSLIEVSLQQAKMDVSFTASKTRVKEGEEIQFYAEIGGGFAPYSYEWDFGDGTTSTSDYPTHAYKDDGSYTVSLKVTDDRGNSDTEIRSDYITVTPGWSGAITTGSAWKGLAAFGRGLADFFIWVGIFSPVWAVIIGIILWRRHRKKKKASL